MKDKNTEVLIIGAGPSGLTLSALLAQQGVKNIVIDKKPATQKFPAAHVLRPYSMNIFSSIGALEEIEENIADICKKMEIAKGNMVTCIFPAATVILAKHD